MHQIPVAFPVTEVSDNERIPLPNMFFDSKPEGSAIFVEAPPSCRHFRWSTTILPPSVFRCNTFTSDLERRRRSGRTRRRRLYRLRSTHRRQQTPPMSFISPPLPHVRNPSSRIRVFRNATFAFFSLHLYPSLTTVRATRFRNPSAANSFHALQTLSDDWCWSIFRERAFLAGRLSLPELEEIGREIVKKCRGLPLLVNVIGGMLRNYNTDKEKWLSIKDSKVWDLEDEGDRVQNSLKLSFDNLPNSIIKQCFAYCSIFKKDKVMRREELIRLWMALGLVQADERRNREAEDVGNDIFQILVSSSLFQDVKMDEYGYVTGCMHDLVHDLSLSLSKHENFCLVDPTSDDDIARIPRVKHLAMCRFQEDGIYITFRKLNSIVFKEDMTNRTMHTLIFRGTIEKNISFQRFKCLRILKFRASTLKKINDSIGELVHLRYLDLSYTKIKVLPKSICKLYHLQTLKLSGCFLKQLPRSISKLISLRHLMYTEYRILLGHIPIRDVGRLTSLRTLPNFRVGREKRCQISELGPLKHLAGKLTISNLEYISGKEDAAKADICGKKNVCQVNFHWSEYRGVNENNK